MPRNSRANMHTRSSTVVSVTICPGKPRKTLPARSSKSPVTRPDATHSAGALNVAWENQFRCGRSLPDLTLDPERELPIGAHVVTPRRGSTHHGIYVGRGRVVQYGG